MRILNLITLLLMAIAQTAYSQINWGEYSESFPEHLTDMASTTGLILAIPKDNNSFWIDNANSKYFSKISNDTAFTRIRPKDIIARTTFDTAKAQFFLHGVNTSNAKNYQFRVLEYPNRIVVPWSAITQFSNGAVIASSGMPQMAYLGGYKTTLGKMLIVDVRSMGSSHILGTAVVAYETIQPVIQSVYTSNDLNLFLKQLTRPWSVKNADIAKQQYRGNQLAPAHSSPELVVAPGTNGLIFLLKAAIYHKEQVQYQLVQESKVIIPWKYNDFDNNFVWLTNLSSGHYQVQIRYTAQPQHVTSYWFEIDPFWYQSLWFKALAGLLISTFFGAIAFLLLLIRQRQKARKELSYKTKLQLELKTIYAQLNPHFVFNALSSIQGLINKQDIKGANHYLADFSKLMRKSLQHSNKDEISLNEELQTLGTYLKLEQLRFGFQYYIHVDTSINSNATNIPALFLQPLIENAVKHGVSALQTQGIINITFIKDNSNMTVDIADNGNGFRPDQPSSGFGLKLTHDRVKLINELSTEQNISLEITSHTPSGTAIRLIFNNWFL